VSKAIDEAAGVIIEDCPDDPLGSVSRFRVLLKEKSTKACTE
jgi:hypothetical protein